jgi:hypothetical protein
MKIFSNFEEAMREGYEPWARNERVGIVRRGPEGSREIALVLSPYSTFGDTEVSPPDVP